MNGYFIITVLINLLFVFVKSIPDIPESVFDNIVAKRPVDQSEIVTLQNTTDNTYFLLYYKKSSNHSRIIGAMLLNMAKKLENLVEILLVDCSNFKSIECKDDHTKDDIFPKMKVLVPPEYRFNPYTKKMNTYREVDFRENSVSENILFNFITRNIVSHSQLLTSSSIDNFLK